MLEVADQVASVVGGTAGALSLVVSVIALRGQDSPGRRVGPPRRRLWAGIGCSVGAAAVSALDLGGGAPTPYAAALPSTAALAGLTAVAFILAHLRARRGASLIGPGPLRDLLAGQREETERHGYRFGRLYVPKLNEIYIQQRAETAGAADSPTLLTVRDVLARGGHAIVVAGPGGGKSTVVSMVARESAEWWLAARRSHRRTSAPFGGAVAVRLPATAALAGQGLAEALATVYAPAMERQTTGEQHSESLREMFAGPPLPKTAWLVLVDGLDEVVDTEARSRLIYRLNTALTAAHSPYRIMVTTRPLVETQAVALRVPGVGDFRLRPFGTTELRRFAERWFTARMPHEPEAARRAAVDFIDEVRDAGLEALVRVPLLATMAALIFKAGEGGGLPTTRTELFREFVALLREGRIAPPPHDQDTDLPEWLLEAVDGLVVTTATAQVEGNGERLLDLAAEQIRRMRPDVPESQWSEALYAVLLSTSLFDGNDGELAFVHRSIAEYLAAGARGFDEARWRREMAEPFRRSLALFTLARAGPEPAVVIEHLMAGPEPDPVCAGYVVADGANVSVELRERIIETLLRRLRDQHDQAVDCLTVLLSFAPSGDVHPRLGRIAEDRRVGPWVRAVIADALFDIGSEAGVPLIRLVIETLTPEDHPAGRWLVQRLLSRDVGLSTSYLATDIMRLDLGGETGGLALHAVLLILEDARQPILMRLRAVEILLAAGDGRGLPVLRGIVGDHDVPPAERLAAALVLESNGDPAGPRTLHQLITDGELAGSDLVSAAAPLLPAEDPDVLRALVEMVSDTGTHRDARRSALEMVAGTRSGVFRLLQIMEEASTDPWLRAQGMGVLGTFGTGTLHDVLHDSARAPLRHRLWVARALMWRRHGAGETMAAQVACGVQASAEDRVAAARLLLAEAQSIGTGRLLDLVACARLPDPIRGAALTLLALRRDRAAVDALGAVIKERYLPAPYRAWAASTLCQNPHVPAPVLRAIVDDDEINKWIRFAALSVLGTERLLQLALDEQAPADARIWAISRCLRARPPLGAHRALVRRAAMDLATDTGRSDEIRKAALLSLAPDDDPAVSLETLRALTRFVTTGGASGDLHHTAVVMLKAGVGRAPTVIARDLVLTVELPPWLREAAVNRLLGDFGPHTAAVLDTLVTSPAIDAGIRSLAGRTILMAGSARRDESLLTLVRDERVNPSARLAVATELKGAATPLAWELLRQADVPPDLRSEAAATLLSEADPPARDVFIAVIERLRADDPVRSTLAKGLARIAPSQGVVALRAVILETTVQALRSDAADALFGISRDDAVATLEILLARAGNSAETTLWAGRLLALEKHPVGAAALQALTDDSAAADDTRSAAALGLLEAGRPVPRETLVELLGHRSGGLWRHVMHAAERTAGPPRALLAELATAPAVPEDLKAQAVALLVALGHPAAGQALDRLLAAGGLEAPDRFDLGVALDRHGDRRAAAIFGHVVDDSSASFDLRLDAARFLVRDRPPLRSPHDAPLESDAPLERLTRDERLKPEQRLRALDLLINGTGGDAGEWDEYRRMLVPRRHRSLPGRRSGGPSARAGLRSAELAGLLELQDSLLRRLDRPPLHHRIRLWTVRAATHPFAIASFPFTALARWHRSRRAARWPVPRRHRRSILWSPRTALHSARRHVRHVHDVGVESRRDLLTEVEAFLGEQVDEPAVLEYKLQVQQQLADLVTRVERRNPDRRSP